MRALGKRTGLTVDIVRRMYEDECMSQSEIAAAFGCNQVSVSLFMRHNGIERRVAAKRDQRGEKNASWRGDRISYKGAHSRVRLARGAPLQCRRCGSSEQVEWANLTGKLHDPSDYEEMCRSCHRKYDGAQRNFKGATGGRRATA